MSSSLPLQMAKRNRQDHHHTEELSSDLLSRLPDELIIDILSRLPIELLLKLRCFGKAFCDIIDDPYFRNLSTDRLMLDSHSVRNPVSFLTLIQINDEEDYRFHFGEYDDVRQNYKVTKPIMYPTLNPGRKGLDQIIVGSCNGLVCYADKHRIKFPPIYVFNPVTRERLDLTPLRYVSESDHVVNGFGYHPVTKEYKVVRIYYDAQKNAAGEVEVYTLGTGEWRSVGKVPSFVTVFYNDDPGVLVNGALHWYDYKGSIASFDLATENFDFVPSPSSFRLVPDGHSWYNLYALEERLCVIDHFEDTRLYIWVLNEDQSWTKDFSVKMQIDPKKSLRSQYKDISLDVDTCTPITMTKSGKLLLWYNYKIFGSYDWKSKEKRLYGEYKAGHFNEIVPHVKSFVSLKALGEKHAKILDGKDLCFLTLIQFHEDKYYRFHFGEYDNISNDYTITKPLARPLLNLRNKGMDNVIVGSCNGLVCYGEHRRIKFDPIYVFNPVTREHLNLTPLGSVSKLYCASVVNGFGYHPVIKEYKVVRIYYDTKKGAGGEVEVYTLGTGEWRRVGKVPSRFNVFHNFPGVLVNRALHWYDYKGSIAAFDLATENFQPVPSPSSLTLVPDSRNWYNLCALRDRLCVIDHVEASRIDIWELNKDQSWTKEFSVETEIDPPLCSNDESLKHDCCTPVTFTKCGKLLLWYNYKIFASYDPKNGEKIIYGEYKPGHFNEIVVHVKSFVSLKSLGKMRR